MIEIYTLLLLSGAVLYHTLQLPLSIIIGLSTLTSAFFFIYFLSRKALLYGLIVGGMVVLGALIVQLREHSVPRNFFSNRLIVGITQSVDRRLDKTVFIIKDKKFNENIQVTTYTRFEVLPGDSIEIAGAVQQPKDFLTDTGRLFPYQKYLASKNIMGTITASESRIISKGNFSLMRTATIARFAIADMFTRYIAFPIDGMVAGMLVGYQGGIPQNVQDLFRTTGVLHVLVLSGENITLLAAFLSILFRALPFKMKTLLTACAIVLIVLISGAGVAAVRAGIMGSIALLAGVTRRKYMPFRALTISVLFFFFISPETIFSDPGFHLSVLATLFMILVFPKLESVFQFLPKRFNIRELATVAVGVPLFMLPYTMYFSGLVPLAAPFANIVVAIMVPFFMLGGAVVLSLSWFAPFVQIIGTLISFVGNTLLKIVEILNTLPQLNAPPLAWWSVTGIYSVLFIMLFYSELRGRIFQLRTNLSGRGNQ